MTLMIMVPARLVAVVACRPHAAPHLMWRHSCCGSVMQLMLAAAEALPGGLLGSDDGHLQVGWALRAPGTLQYNKALLYHQASMIGT